MRSYLAWLIIILLPASALQAQQGKLDKLRQDVRAEQTGQQHEHDCCDDDDGDSIFGAILGSLVGGFVSSLVKGSRTGEPETPVGYFLEYPYAQDRLGCMWIDDPKTVVDPNDDPLVKPWSARLSIEESNDFDGLNRVNGLLLLENSLGLGLQGSWSIVDERLAGARHDGLFLGDLNVTCRFIESERSQFRLGLGCRMLSDSQTDWGINGTLSGDLYPCRPIIVSTLFDVGTLGSATVFHGRGTVGVIYRCFEIFGGYDYLKIGSVDLQGPVLGLRLWF